MLILAMMLQTGVVDADTMLSRAGEKLLAEPRCAYDPNSTDITVCGLRRADRYRVPFVVHDAGDPRYESVAAERERLLHRTTPVEDMSPFLVESGMVSVSVGTSGGGPVTLRKTAP